MSFNMSHIIRVCEVLHSTASVGYCVGYCVAVCMGYCVYLSCCILYGVGYFVFPLAERLHHLQCSTKSNHLLTHTDYVTLTICRLNTAYVYLICSKVGVLMGFYGLGV